jgi:hypothetical protein
MIGVIADPAEHNVVSEFFELFKTPWEFYRTDRHYDVLLCAGDGKCEEPAKLLLLYASRKTPFDEKQKIQTGRQQKHACVLLYQGNRIPIYGGTISISEKGSPFLTVEGSQECVANLNRTNDRALVRIGYDLFGEIRTLLTVGQPLANANLPALELHIALLRDLITGCGVRLVEIPPIPDGSRFVVCLTHDVDHPSIRQHKWDHTMFGFLYRAILGSFWKFFCGRMPIQDLLTNWAAALSLPLVYLGLVKDFWREFGDRYLELEGSLPSTFFVIPNRDHQGKNSNGLAPRLRAAGYEAQDIADAIQKLMTAGCEVGLHGIDAWVDGSRGHAELEKIRNLTGISEIGVRMHWLYYDQQSPSTLETSGATYDSTIGYNETVGYRAGTTQVYKPLDASQLLELPLHVMDTALFFASYLDLSPQQARILLGQMADNAVHFGGTLTINWHDRSLAPERLWGGCYRDLIQDLKSRGAWFSTAGQAISWFRKRRSAAFVTDPIEPGAVRVKVVVAQGNNLPGLRLRIHKVGGLTRIGVGSSDDYVDVAVNESVLVSIPSEARR